MTRIRSRSESREPAVIGHESLHYVRVSDVPADATRAACGSREITRYVHSRELYIIGYTAGAGVGGADRRRSLSRLAPAYASQKRPGRSKETPLYTFTTGLDGSRDFGASENRASQTTVRLRLAHGRQRAARVGRSVPSQEVAGRHTPYAQPVLVWHRLVAGICHHTRLATSPRQDRRFAGTPPAKRYGDVAVRAPKRSQSLRFAPSRQKSSDRATGLLGKGGSLPLCFRQRWRHEVRACDAPAPHHQRKWIASALRSPMRGSIRRDEPQ